MHLLFASEEPNGVHLASDINEVIWGSLAFFVVLGLIIWKAGPAIAKAFNGRTERIAAELGSAAAQKDEAVAALTASTADLPDTNAEEARIKAEAIETAERVKADLIAKAHADAEDIRVRGRADVDNYRRQAVADLTAELSELTKNSAEAVIIENLDAGAHAELIDNYINQVEHLS